MENKQDKNKVIFLKGKKVILRPLRKSTDLETVIKWLNDPEVRQFVSLFMPAMEQSEEKWFDKLAEDKNHIVLAIETMEGRFIGTIGIHGINWQSRKATTGALIGEKDCWGKGYGTDAKMILLDYIFNVLNLIKIGSAVISFNKRSLNYSLHCGYKIEGVLKKEYFKNGRYCDMVLLGIFKKDWLPIWRKYQKTGSVK